MIKEVKCDALSSISERHRGKFVRVSFLTSHIRTGSNGVCVETTCPLVAHCNGRGSLVSDSENAMRVMFLPEDKEQLIVKFKK